MDDLSALEACLEACLPASYHAPIISHLHHEDLPAYSANLPLDVVHIIVNCLKEDADRQWRRVPRFSLQRALVIVAIGESCSNKGIQALGLMAYGDAIKFLGELQEAWDTLGRAGELYLSAGDELGWARTRIGRVYISVNLEAVPEAIAEVQRAEAIFVQHQEYERLLRLKLATARAYDLMGAYEQSLTLYETGLQLADQLGETGQGYLSTLYNNKGYAEWGLGNLRQALKDYQFAHNILIQQAEESAAAITEANIATIAYTQGYYAQALRQLKAAHLKLVDILPEQAARVMREMAECYLSLARHGEAVDLYARAGVAFDAQHNTYQTACTLLQMATAHAESGQFDAALQALNRAELIFERSHASKLIAVVWLRRAQIALRQEEIAVAKEEASRAIQFFESNNQQVNLAAALLVQAEATWLEGDIDTAKSAANHSLNIARRAKVLTVGYNAHVLLGRMSDGTRTRRHYQAAVSLVERVQRDLTITMRPGFLQNKSEALQRLMSHRLSQGEYEQAFNCLERAKAQVSLDYLTARDTLRWPENDPRTRELVEQLTILREKHEWLYKRVNNPPHQEEPILSEEDAWQRLQACEKQMRALTEELYLLNEASALPTFTPSLADIRSHLDDDTLLVEFYYDGQQFWVFGVSRSAMQVCPVALSLSEIENLHVNLRRKISWTLALPPDSSVIERLHEGVKTLGHELYNALILPVLSQFPAQKRLVIVPYGALHELPFNLLHTGSQYLVEQCELILLPAAALLTAQAPTARAGVRALAHTNEDQLTQTYFEAEMVHRLFGGSLHTDATRDILRDEPCQILHIAAHGEHRIDQPDLSFIQLADGQVYADDLLQLDLHYELVTLSACETARSQVAGSDELIGLGRGFLYAGAGALVASLWPVNDQLTVQWMETFYRALHAGATKAAAVCQAHHAAIDQGLHPAFWAAFQLIGSATPLSNSTR